MFELTGRIFDFSRDGKTGKARLTLEIDDRDVAACYDELSGAEKLTIKLGKYRAKRSIDANAYFWVTLSALADRLHERKDVLYRELVQDVPDAYEMTPIRLDAVNRWREIWESKGIGWPCVDLGTSKLPGYTNVINYYGSSVYDSRQMSRLIDLLVSECNAHGVPTRSEAELESLCREWETSRKGGR